MNDPMGSLASAPKPPIEGAWFLTGPTASGKTHVGLELAKLLGAEILSLDSMAVYRGMDIGTAKPSPAERDQVRHHLLDLVDPVAEFSLSQYVEAVHCQVAKLHAAHQPVLFVGGTPLYLKSLLRGLYQGPPADWEFRRQIEEEIARVGIQHLRERLRQVDPLAAAKLHPNDTRRMIRALEVARATGQPLSHQQTQFDEPRAASACRVFVLHWPRAVLHDRIDARVEQMFSAGLIDETRRLLAAWGGLGRTASQAVGYREAIAHLRGERDLAHTVELVKHRTHQFARRQETWFRSLGECRWIEMSPSEDPAQTAARILAAAQTG
jgi:tRNA dimethylallyltransferase